jgi:hypothetical protein
VFWRSLSKVQGSYGLKDVLLRFWLVGLRSGRNYVRLSTFFQKKLEEVSGKIDPHVSFTHPVAAGFSLQHWPFRGYSAHIRIISISHGLCPDGVSFPFSAPGNRPVPAACPRQYKRRSARPEGFVGP